MRILYATTNESKVIETKKILKEIEIDSLKDINLDHIDVIEDRDTIEENAIKKVTEIYDYVKDKNYDFIISEDFTIELEFDKNLIGTHAKRWYEGTDDDRNNKLLEIMNKETKRGITYRSAFAVYNIKDKSCNIFIGELEGIIGEKVVKGNGFAYDFIFKLKDGRYLSELTLDEKNKISTRYIALNKVKDYIIKK